MNEFGARLFSRMSMQAALIDDMGDLHSDAAQDLQCRNVICYDTNGSLYVFKHVLMSVPHFIC